MQPPNAALTSLYLLMSDSVPDWLAKAPWHSQPSVQWLATLHNIPDPTLTVTNRWFSSWRGTSYVALKGAKVSWLNTLKNITQHALPGALMSDAQMWPDCLTGRDSCAIWSHCSTRPRQNVESRHEGEPLLGVVRRVPPWKSVRLTKHAVT